MALTPQNQDAFFREVDDEVRKDQLDHFWRRYGKLVIGLVIAGLIAFGGVLWWQHHQREVAGELGEQLTQALRDINEPSKRAAAEVKLKDIAKAGNAGYQATAQLTLAALALDKGDTKGAAAQYAAIAANDGLAKPFRDLALIRQTTAELDSLPPQQVVDRLKPLAQAGNPWFGSAGEMVALSYMKLNKRDLAGPLYAAIARDETVPESIRGRARRMAVVLGIDMETAPRAAGGK